MHAFAVFVHSISISITTPSPSVSVIKKTRKWSRNFRLFCSSSNDIPKVQYDSLKVLEWDKLCDSVASFARTSLGRDATQAQLWCINQSYEDSLRLLDETNAAIEMHKHGACSLDVTGIDLHLVKSAIQHARRGLPLNANEALAVASLLGFSETLKLNLRIAIKEDADWYTRFMPLSQLIIEMNVNSSLIKLIHQVIDEDGSVKDSASPALRQSRDQVRMLEKKLYQLLDRIVRSENDEASHLEVTNIDGRWCIKSGADQLAFNGLLLSSGSDQGSIIEPLSAVPLNDELQQARASVAKAEEDVLLTLAHKMQVDLEDIEKILNSVIQLDVINARATYSLSFGGTCPYIFLPEDKDGPSTNDMSSPQTSTEKLSYKEREWTLYLPKAYHPLLVQQHKQNLQKARKDLKNAATEIRRQKQGGNLTRKGGDINISSLELQVSNLEHARIVPVDFFIAQKTRVLVITGPNTGGKTICLKTVGLAAMMAKSVVAKVAGEHPIMVFISPSNEYKTELQPQVTGLHVLSSESAQIPWFDYVFADIGDEQSLSQSLSTFSGHLKQISGIQSQSTNLSLVLLDEVGAGTNPLEGAALGMSLLESFAQTGALLTIATTHHGELKTLKYSDDAFENACMEFDEVNLKPTYKILWGVPGRSNAINIAERLGLPSLVVQNARQLYGAASAEINEVIIDMERFKQDFQELLHEARHLLMLSRNLHENLMVTRRNIMEHGSTQRYRKMREISESAATARSFLHKRVRQLRASRAQCFQPSAANKSQQQILASNSLKTTENSKLPMTRSSSSPLTVTKQSPEVKRTEVPGVGDSVHVSSLGKKATVLKVEPSKEEIVVQVGNMKLKLKLTEIKS